MWRVCVYKHMYMNAYMCRPEDNLNLSYCLRNTVYTHWGRDFWPIALELTNPARWTRQEAPGILLFPPLQHWDSQHVSLSVQPHLGFT